MGEYNVELLEQTVKNNVDDVRDLTKRVGYVERDINDLKTNQQVANQTMSHVMDTLTNLKGDFKALDTKIEKSNEKMYEDNIDQLKQYKTTMWSVGASVIGSLIVAVVIFIFNI